MNQRGEIYKCAVCGNIVELIHVGGGELVCCGQPMNLQVEKSEEEGFTEKHLPVLEQTEKGKKVKVGSIPHPMEEAHYIEWIEVQTSEGEVLRKFLKVSDSPEAEFALKDSIVSVRAYCNLHGLWSIKFNY